MLSYYCCCKQHTTALELKGKMEHIDASRDNDDSTKVLRMHNEFNGGLPVMFTQGLCSAKLSMTNVPPRFYYWPDNESTSSSNSADSTCRRKAAASSRGKHAQVV